MTMQLLSPENVTGTVLSSVAEAMMIGCILIDLSFESERRVCMIDCLSNGISVTVLRFFCRLCLKNELFPVAMFVCINMCILFCYGYLYVDAFLIFYPIGDMCDMYNDGRFEIVCLTCTLCFGYLMTVDAL